MIISYMNSFSPVTMIGFKFEFVWSFHINEFIYIVNSYKNLIFVFICT